MNNNKMINIIKNNKMINIHKEDIETKKLMLNSAIIRLEGEYKDLEYSELSKDNIPHIDDLVEKSIILETLHKAQNNKLSKEEYLLVKDDIEKEFTEYLNSNSWKNRTEDSDLGVIGEAYRELSALKTINEVSAEFIDPFRMIDRPPVEAKIVEHPFDKKREHLYVNNFIDYQLYTNNTAIYPKEKALEYITLGLVGEAGEIANKVKKVLRGDKPNDDAFKKDMEGESGDLLWYLAQFCEVLGLDLGVVARNNAKKLNKRKEDGKLKGDGDNR